MPSCGVCHSDLHIHEGSFDLGGGAKLPLAGLNLPHTLGHEIAGTIESAGRSGTTILVEVPCAAEDSHRR